jgi:hypothetical protein
MKYTRITISKILLCFTVFYTNLTLAVFSEAFAATIVNLDSKAHTFTADSKEVVLEPNRVWQVPGYAKIIFKNREIHMEDLTEYAIWSDYQFGPQRRVLQIQRQ